MKNVYISTYYNLKSTTSIDVPMLQWLQDTSHKEIITKIRFLTNKDEIRKLKSTLPCATISGIFSVRKSDSLIKHSGYICIDIDGKENETIRDFTLLRDELRNILNVSYASISVSGNGVFCIIPITHTDKHKEHFNALKECFYELGIVIDKACSDITRTRIISYDPDAYINENALPFDEVLDIDKSKRASIKKTSHDIRAKTRPHTTTENKIVDKSTHSKVMKVIAEINRTGIDITSTYDDWMEIGASLASEFGEEGRDLFDLVSQNHPGYHPEVCDRKYDDFSSLASSFTIGTFFHHAKLNGLT